MFINHQMFVLTTETIPNTHKRIMGKVNSVQIDFIQNLQLEGKKRIPV